MSYPEARFAGGPRPEPMRAGRGRHDGHPAARPVPA